MNFWQRILSWIRPAPVDFPTPGPVVPVSVIPRPVPNPASPPPIPAGNMRLTPAGNRLISEDGMKLVEHFEGLYLHAYLDSVNVPTIGWGRIKYDDGRFVKMGDTCTREQADQWLLEDIEKDGAQYVRANFPFLNAPQFSALVSFCYNRGAGRLHELHTMAGEDPAKIADCLLLFNYAGTPHRYLLGLDRRRWSEREMFIGGDWRRFSDVHAFEAFKARGYRDN